MKAEKYITAGEEVYNTYGDLPNAKLLTTYGFVENTNPFGYFEIPTDLFLKTIANLQQKAKLYSMTPENLLEDQLQILNDMNLLVAPFVISMQDMFPSQLITALFVLLIEPDELTEFKKQPMLIENFDEIEIEAEDLVLQIFVSLLQILNEKLKIYPTTLKEDRELQMDPHITLSLPKKAALIIRIAEKELLVELKSHIITELMKEKDQDPENYPNKREKRKEQPKSSKQKHKKRKRTYKSTL